MTAVKSRSAWDRVAICRHLKRPHGIDYLQEMATEFTELSGDRLFRDDPAIMTGFARIGGVKFLIVAQEKGATTEDRLKRSFGMPHPEGYRKALRCMRLAAKFQIPILALVDTPGAHPGLSSEERGQGWAIARNLLEMARLPTPVIVVVIGEGCSGGALGIAIGDEVAMLEHAYYSVISPEGCASILWRDADKRANAASALKMQAEDLLKMGVIDQIIDEPEGGAHEDPSAVYAAVRKYAVQAWNRLKGIPIDELLERRYQKFRALGASVNNK